jgi:DNA-binding FadR family transcriptional regulator
VAHDLRFHRAVAAGARNAVLGALIEMVAGLFFEQRRRYIEHAHDLGDSAEQHRRIYLAIRARDAERARTAMADHLRSAQAAQAAEGDEPAAGADEAPRDRRRREAATKRRRQSVRKEAR